MYLQGMEGRDKTKTRVKRAWGGGGGVVCAAV